MELSKPIEPSNTTTQAVYYLLWTFELQQKMLLRGEARNEEYGSKTYESFSDILNVVPKADIQSAILFRVSPFDLNQLEDVVYWVDLPDDGQMHYLCITGDTDMRNIVRALYRAEYFELFILPTKMQKVFEKQILKDYPACILA